MNSYPFLDNKLHPISNIELGEIVPRVRRDRIIDVSDSSLIPATELREKLDSLLMTGELDGGLPILKNSILVGLLPAPDLEYALDQLEDEDEDTMCLMSVNSSYPGIEEYDGDRPTDFSRYIDPVCIVLSPSPTNILLRSHSLLTYLLVTRGT